MLETPLRIARVSHPWTVATAVAAIALFATGLWPALGLGIGASSETVVEASRIQSLDRLAHHQLASDFTRWTHFIPLVLAFMVLVRMGWNNAGRDLRRYNLITISALLIAIAGVVLSFVAQNMSGWCADFATRLLTLYLFRLADVLVPIATIINLLVTARSLPVELGAHRSLLAGMMILVIVSIGLNARKNFVDPRSPSAVQGQDQETTLANLRRAIEYERNWIQVCCWIRDNTDEDSIFLTPGNNQTFKWYAQRAEWATWKDMPQDPASVKTWFARRRDQYFESNSDSQWSEQQHWQFVIGPMMLCRGKDGSRLEKFSEENNVDYLVVSKLNVERYCSYFDLTETSLPSCLVRIYPDQNQANTTFVVFRIE